MGCFSYICKECGKPVNYKEDDKHLSELSNRLSELIESTQKLLDELKKENGNIDKL